MKRILAIVLAMLMVITSLSIAPAKTSAASIADVGICGAYLEWELQDELLIIRGTGQMFDYTASYDAPWSPYIQIIEKIIIEPGVTSIGDYAFKNLRVIEKIEIPEGIESIGSYAFYNCQSLKTVIFPSTVKTVNQGLLKNCSSLEAVVLPESLKTIEKEAFDSCKNFRNIYYLGTEAGWKNVQVNSTSNTPLNSAKVNYYKQPVIEIYGVQRPIVGDNLSFNNYVMNSSDCEWGGFELVDGITTYLYWNETGFEPTSFGVLPSYVSYTSLAFDNGYFIAVESGKWYSLVFLIKAKSGKTLEYGVKATINGERAYVDKFDDNGTYAVWLTRKAIDANEMPEYTLNFDYAEVQVKEKIQLNSDFKLKESSYGKVRWSSDSKYITVDQNGLVTVSGYDIAYIKAENDKDYAICEVQARFKDVQEQKYFLSKKTYSEGVNGTGYNAIYWAASKGITKGYSDGTFRPSENVRRDEMLIFLWRLAGSPSVAGDSIKFTDSSKILNNTARKAIIWAVQNGITKGYSDGTFRPQNPVTRAELCIFLYRLAKLQKRTDTGKGTVINFKDAADIKTGKTAITWAVSEGIVKGYTSGANAGKFCPNDHCTRQQLAIMLMRYEKEE